MKKSYLNSEKNLILLLKPSKAIRLFLMALFVFIIPFTSLAQVTGDYRSNNATVSWTSATNWQRYNAGWVAAANPPSAQTFTNNTITVQSGHTCTYTGNTNISYTLTTGNTLVVNGTFIIENTRVTPSRTTTLIIDPGATIVLASTSSNSIKEGTNGLGGATVFTMNGTLKEANVNGVTGTTGAVDSNINTVTLATTGNYEFNGAGVQSATGLPATVNNLTLSGTASVTTLAAQTVSGNLSVGDGTTFTVPAFALTVTGTTTIGAGTSGMLAISSATGTKTFTGAVTINSGAALTESAAATLTFGSDVTIGGTLTEFGAATVGVAGNFTNNGTYTASTGVHTFSGTGKTISGTEAIAIPSLTINGTTTNSGVLTVSTALAGSSTLTNATTGVLNIGGTSAITGLTATAISNTVNYNGAVQTIKATTYRNLTLSGSGGKTFPAGTTNVNGILSIENGANANTFTGSLAYGTSATLQYNTTSDRTAGAEWPTAFSGSGGVIVKNTGDITLNNAKTVTNTLNINTGAVANLGTFTHTAGALSLGGLGVASGSWGSTTSAATNKNNTYFSATTGIVNVTTTVSGCNTAVTVIPNKVDICSTANNGSITPAFTGGLANVRYIKLSQKYNNSLHLAEIQAFEIFTGINVALSTNGAVASSPNTSYTGDYPASEVNDGISNLDANMWHGDGGTSDLVQIDLQSAKNLDYIRIYNRVGCCWDRAQNILLELFDGSNNLIYCKTINVWEGVNGSNYIDVNVLDVSWTPAYTTSLNRTGLGAGTYTLNYADGAGYAVNTPVTINVVDPTITTAATPAVVTAVCQSAVAQTTTMAYTATTNNPTSYSIDWATLTDQVSTPFVFVAGGGSVTGIVVPAGTAAATYTGTMTITNANGCIATKTVTLTVNALPTVASTTGNSKIYTGTPNATTVSAVAGAGETIDWYANITGGTVLVSGSGSGTITYAPTGVNVGTYTVYAEKRNTTTGCVSTPRIAAALTITKANSTITATGATSFTYTGLVQGPATSTVSGSTGVVTYSYSGTGATTYVASATPPTNAGTYQVVASVAADTNYNGASSAPLAFTINKAVLTITADNQSVSYGTSSTTVKALATYTVTGFVNGETSLVIGGSVTYTTPYTSSTAAGTSGVMITPVVSTLTATNYSFTAATGTITVIKASITVTANNQSKTYGTTQATPVTGSSEFTITSGSLQNTETIGSVTLTYGAGALPGNAAVGSTSVITPSVATGGTFTASNYTITYATGTETVVAAAITITANAQNKTYGAIQSTPITGSTAFTITSGSLQNSETIGSVTLTYGAATLPATATVGSTSVITPSAATGGTFTASNYTITYAIGTETVVAAAITITANAQSKCYGTALTLGTTAFTTSALQNGETITSVTITSSGGYDASLTQPASLYAGDIVPSNPTGAGFAASNYIITMINGDLTIDPLPSAPIVGTPIQPNCVTPTGSVVLSGLPAGSWTISPGGITGSTSSVTISGLTPGTHNFTVSNGTCTSVPTVNVVINPVVTTTWNGTVWTPSTPTSSDAAIIDGNYSVSSNGNLDVCSLTINAGYRLSIESDQFVVIQNHLTIGNGAVLDVLDKGSLVMVNDLGVVTNTGTGTAIVRRRTTPFKKSDYIYWSTPVSTTAISSASTGAFPGWKTSSAYQYNDAWVAAFTMTPGKGYIVMVPDPTALPGGNESGAIFKGKVNNGVYNINVVANKSYLIGNPYPSAIDADQFILQNSGVIGGALYFWTHATAIQLASTISNPGSGAYAYTSDDYATYNIVGGVGAVTAGNTNSDLSKVIVPNGKIASGQGFFTTTKASSLSGTSFVFNNSMRISSGAGSNFQFFKTKSSKNNKSSAPVMEKHRVWLNLSNTQGAFKQTLLGYVSGATNGDDVLFDGKTLDGNKYVDFYSVNQSKNLVIQGRALPFDDNDEVQLGYKTAIDGTFTINIDKVDGLLINKAIFLEDKLTKTVFNLKNGNYTFTTVKGTFNNRFVLKYSNKTLGTEDFKAKTNQVLVSVKNKQIKINSFQETIEKVLIYDVSGKQIYKNENVNNNELAVANFTTADQVLIVKTTLSNGAVTTDKIVF